jgi:adenylate kinase
LAEWIGGERVVTGDLLRAARREGTELGKKAQAYMDAGDLVPDSLIVEMVREHLSKVPVDRGLLFDGFPRTVVQAEAFGKVLAGTGRALDGVVLLEAADETLVRRIGGRRSCPQCGRVYNVHLDPPISEGICDQCGAVLDHRKDDRPETVRHRLAVYREMTEPLIDYYEKGTVPVLRVDGEGAIEDVRRDIQRALAERLDVEG